MHSEIKNLIDALYQSVGNKRYMQSIETLLLEKGKDLSPEQKQAIRYLASDLRQLRQNADNKSRKFW